MKKNIGIYAICFVVLAAVSYTGVHKICSTGVNETSTNGVIQYHSDVDYPMTYDIDKIINESDIIVSGQYQKYTSSWNMARNPENILEEAKDMYIEGRLYEFKVDNYLKGGSDSTISVNLSYSHNGTIDETYIEPVVGEKVVLFLKKDSNFNNYYGSIEPFQFSLGNDMIYVKTNIKDVRNSFEGGMDIPFKDLSEKISLQNN